MMRISVVIPALNEEEALPDLLEALVKQTRPPDEIIVVDAGSTDGTVGVVQEWGRKDRSIRYLKGRRGGCGIGRNIGIQATECEWIVILDCGMVPVPAWLASLMETQQRTQAPAVFGTCVYEPGTLFQKALCATAWGERPVPVVPCSLFHRSVFHTVGLFRQDLPAVEDREWTRRFLRRYGDRCVMREVTTPHKEIPGNIQSVYRKWHFYARCAVRAGVLNGQQALYLLGAPIVLVILASSWQAGAGLALMYVALRGVWLPLSKGVSVAWLLQPANLARVLAIAVTIDVAKALGFAAERLSMAFNQNRVLPQNSP
jgi:glycosyltransferase involved in cell wall biosynthesis